MKTKISIRADVLSEKLGRKASPEELNSVSRVVYDSEFFSDYILDSNEKNLIGLKIGSGILKFEIHDQELFAVVEYESEDKLDVIQHDALERYTIGQLRDGIGENFTQKFVEETGLFVSF